jgi:hypothetical protein
MAQKVSRQPIYVSWEMGQWQVEVLRLASPQADEAWLLEIGFYDDDCGVFFSYLSVFCVNLCFRLCLLFQCQDAILQTPLQWPPRGKKLFSCSTLSAYGPAKSRTAQVAAWLNAPQKHIERLVCKELALSPEILWKRSIELFFMTSLRRTDFLSLSIEPSSHHK